jgi:integrase
MARQREKTDRRVRRDLSRMGIGVLQLTSPATNRRAIERHHAIVDKLVEDSQVEVLRALKDRKVSLDELVDLERQGRLSGAGVLATVQLQRPLFAAWDEAAARLGKGAAGRRRYAVTRLSLERKGAPIITAQTLVADLGDPAKVDWEALRAQWEGSPADWNHLRRAVSRLLTVLLGDKFHPFRRQVVSRIPLVHEPARTPDLSPERFWAIMERTREDARAAYVTLVATGMRIGEYLACTKDHLLPATASVRVPGTKTEGSAAVIAVDERLWPWVQAGIPAPLQYKRLREIWHEACAAAGVEHVVLHDLRHCHAQWATDQGAALARVAGSLRHSSTTMTERYARSTDTRQVSSAVADALLRGTKRA